MPVDDEGFGPPLRDPGCGIGGRTLSGLREGRGGNVMGALKYLRGRFRASGQPYQIVKGVRAERAFGVRNQKTTINIAVQNIQS